MAGSGLGAGPENTLPARAQVAALQRAWPAGVLCLALACAAAAPSRAQSTSWSFAFQADDTGLLRWSGTCNVTQLPDRLECSADTATHGPVATSTRRQDCDNGPCKWWRCVPDTLTFPFLVDRLAAKFGNWSALPVAWDETMATKT